LTAVPWQITCHDVIAFRLAVRHLAFGRNYFIRFKLGVYAAFLGVGHGATQVITVQLFYSSLPLSIPAGYDSHWYKKKVLGLGFAMVAWFFRYCFQTSLSDR
jgi:hypothetical protein